MAAARKPPAAKVKAEAGEVYNPTDRLEAQRAAAKPFRVELSDGQILDFRHPQSLHHRLLARLQEGTSLEDAMAAILGPEQYAVVVDHPDADGFWMEDVFDRFRVHFGLPRPGEAPASSA